MRHQASYPKRSGCEIQGEFEKLRSSNQSLCLICKGSRLLCGNRFCPLLSKIDFGLKVKEKLSKDFFGPAPSVFIGHHGYPGVFVGPMAAVDPERAGILDDPAQWYGSSIQDIVEMRSSLIRSKRRMDVHEQSGYLEQSKEVALSVRPTDVEVSFKQKPAFNLSFSDVSQPMGPSGEVKDFKLAQNPKIPRKVDYVLSDELNADQAALKLYSSDFDVYYLSRALSTGALGMQDRRKLVPTRWSITAVDDIIAKSLMGDVRTFPELSEFLVFENTYLENHFEVLFIPGKWEFELFEAWAPNTLWTLGCTKPVLQAEYEPYSGRTSYAKKEGGGYYAGRIGVVEKLWRMRRQGRCVVFREIYEGYTVPVGVWEVRENVRNALKKKPSRFSSLPDALSDIAGRLRLPVGKYLEASEILRQRKLSEFF